MRHISKDTGAGSDTFQLQSDRHIYPWRVEIAPGPTYLKPQQAASVDCTPIDLFPPFAPPLGQTTTGFCCTIASYRPSGRHHSLRACSSA